VYDVHQKRQVAAYETPHMRSSCAALIIDSMIRGGGMNAKAWRKNQ